MKFKINNLNVLYGIEDFWPEVDKIEKNKEKNSPEQDKNFVDYMNWLDNKNPDIKDFWSKINQIIKSFNEDPDAKESWIAEKVEEAWKKTFDQLEELKTKLFEKTPKNFQNFCMNIRKKNLR